MTDKLPPTRRATCGSYAGYQAHRKAGEHVCDDCRPARNVWEADRRAARRRATDLAQLTTAERDVFLYCRKGWEDDEIIAVVEDLIAGRILKAERLTRTP